MLRLDTVSQGTVQPYLFFKAYNSSGLKLDDNENSQTAAITPGQAIVMPFSSSLDQSQVGYVDFYVKFAMRSADAMVESLCLQVAPR